MIADLATEDQSIYFESCYQELKTIARSRLRHAPQLTLLDTVGLVNDAFLKAGLNRAVKFENEGHFLAYMSSTMRTLVIDHLRAKHSLRRGGNEVIKTLDTFLMSTVANPEEQIINVSGAVDELALVAPRLAEMVEMRFFGGFTEEEIATAMSISARTVKRDWEKAKIMLLAMLAD
jgi:RNA polymerase sigma factor (TIGR02999 family)